MKNAAIAALLAVLLTGCRNEADPITNLEGICGVTFPPVSAARRGQQLHIEVQPLPGGQTRCVITRTA